MTLTARDLMLGVGGALVLVAFALAVRWSGSDGGPVEVVSAEHPLVIEAPSLRIAAGSDTATIFGPTLFVFLNAGVAEGEPPRGFQDAAEALAAAVADARVALADMGVKVLSVEAVPVALGIPAAVDAEAGPRIPAIGVGLLFADGRGRLRRLDRAADGATLVCAAAATFRLLPPPPFDGACPP